ncbi:protein-tyrosine phosphatase family protein [Kocuria sp. CPCC 205235]|uniref:protein-tyrosine phosphatase family protein n=1 Tax=Kocuria sp. CPCC 205235 TaxID=3073549 RepID=UPI0034D74152
MGAWETETGVLKLPDGRVVRGTGVRCRRRGASAPEFAIYLLGKDPRIEAWPYRWTKWPEFRTPANTFNAVAALSEAHERAMTERVEIACSGGVGRTGTAIALLAVMSGVAADDALAWARAHYHPRAVETRGQKRWLRDAARSVHGG